MSGDLALMLSVGAGFIALIYGALSIKWILGQSDGNERMQEIAGAIQEGASAYLNRQYTAIGIVGAVLTVALWLTLGTTTAIGFLIGAVFSGATGFIGINVNRRPGRSGRKVMLCRLEGHTTTHRRSCSGVHNPF